MEDNPHDTPSEVTAEEGEVLVDGPNDQAYSFTPAAAEETSHRLLDAAAEARGQQVEKGWKSQGKGTTGPDQA